MSPQPITSRMLRTWLVLFAALALMFTVTPMVVSAQEEEATSETVEVPAAELGEESPQDAPDAPAATEELTIPEGPAADGATTEATERQQDSGEKVSVAELGEMTGASPAQHDPFFERSGSGFRALGDAFAEGDWRSMRSVANPSVPQRCGMNIALVFDLSNSLQTQNGVAKSQEAGRAFVNALAGTPTTLGMYTFASYSPINGLQNLPALNLENRADVSRAYNLINGFKTGGETVGGIGGTNWQTALEQVQGKGYDIVYFITDGVPTTNVGFEPGGDDGYITHNIDITRAITAANTLKRQGTRLEVIGVNLPDYELPVLKDNVTMQTSNPFEGFYDSYRRWYEDSLVRSQRFYSVRSGSAADNLLQNYVGAYGWVSYSGLYRLWFRNEDTLGFSRAGTPGTQSIPWLYWNGNYATQYYESVPYGQGNWPYADDIVKRISDTRHYLSSYDQLTSKLQTFAAEMCEGKVLVRKQIVDADGNLQGESNVGGWQFTADSIRSDDRYNPIYLVNSNDAQVSSLQGTTKTWTNRDPGYVEFPVKTDVPHKSGSMRVTETQQDGYSLRPQAGRNATCTLQDGSEVQVQNDGAYGFRVPIATNQAVLCTVQNTAVVQDFKVSKRPAVDQNPDRDGNQSTVTLDQNGEFDAYYTIAVTNNSRAASYLENPVVDTVRFPEGITVNDVRFYLGTRTTDQELTATKNADGAYEIAGEQFGRFAGEEVKQILVRVSATASAEVIKQIDGDADKDFDLCTSSTPSNANDPRSLFNSVSLEGENDPRGETNNHACVDPEHEKIQVSKFISDINGDGAVDEGDIGELQDDGTRSITYEIRVTNPGETKRTYTLVDTPAFSGSVEITRAEIQFERRFRDAGVSLEGEEAKGPFDLVDLVHEEEEHEIDANSEHVYRITLHFTGPQVDVPHPDDECSPTEGAGHGLFNRVRLTSGIEVDNDDDCLPVPPPAKVKLIVNKVDDSDTPQPLLGSRFAVHEVNSDDSVGDEVQRLAFQGTGAHHGEVLPNHPYFLVETQAPKGFSLLPSPVKFQVVLKDGVAQIEILNPDDSITASVIPHGGSTTGQSKMEVIMQVADITSGKLPKTGGAGVWLTLGIAVLVIVGGSLGVWRTVTPSKKQQKEQMS